MSFKQVGLSMQKSYNETDYPYKSELQEPLKTPEDIIEAVEKSKLTGDHNEIHKILEYKNINLSKNIH